MKWLYGEIDADWGTYIENILVSFYLLKSQGGYNELLGKEIADVGAPAIGGRGEDSFSRTLIRLSIPLVLLLPFSE